MPRNAQPSTEANAYWNQLQTRAREILATKPEGMCGGNLSQQLQKVEEKAVWALFGNDPKNAGKLQKGWLMTVMRGLSDVEFEKSGGGRDFMYKFKEGAAQNYVMQPSGPQSVSVSHLFAVAAVSERLSAAKPAAQMVADDFLGRWMDSLGNVVDVLQNARETVLTAVLSRPPRKDIHLAVYPTDLGAGWVTWCCGNSMLDLQSSTSEQLCWASMNGHTSVWMRNPTDPKTPVDSQSQPLTTADNEEPAATDKLGKDGAPNEAAQTQPATTGDEGSGNPQKASEP